MAITFVDHHHGGQDALTYQTQLGQPINRANIQIFRLEDWQKGNRTNRHLVGKSATNSKGRWIRAIPLTAGRYAVVFSGEGYDPSVAEIEVQ